jgi:hypothetical protein
MRLKSIDYVYVLLACIAGVWQAWCFNYGINYGSKGDFTVVAMSVPFALASYAHAWFLNRDGAVGERPDWKRALVLWAGMELSLVVAFLTIFAETGIMLAAGFGIVNLPFDALRLLIGEGAACLAWATCLLIFARRPVLRPPIPVLASFAALFAGVLIAAGLATLIRRSFQKDFYLILTSIIATAISALILIFLRRGARVPQPLT